MNKLRSVLVKTVGLGLLFVVSAANAALVTVDPADQQGWFVKNSNTGTVDLTTANPHGTGGTGSLVLNSDGSVGQIVQATRIPVPLVTVAQFTAISWDVYTDNATNYPAPRIEFWSFRQSGTLVYQASNFTPALNTWQTVTVDFNSDLWRDTDSNELRTLAEWQATTVGTIPSNFFYIGYGSTSGSFPATTAFADMVQIATTQSDDTWDFEGVVALPPAPVADIEMIKTLDTVGPYTVGDTIQYTLRVINSGPDAATNVQVGDLPTNLTITSVASTNCTALPCTVPSIAAFQDEHITVMATINAAGAFDNAAGALAEEDDPDLANNGDNTGNGGTADAPPVVVPPVPAPAEPVPTMSEWALITLAMLLAGIVFVRRKQLS